MLAGYWFFVHSKKPPVLWGTSGIFYCSGFEFELITA